MEINIKRYIDLIQKTLNNCDYQPIITLGKELLNARIYRKQVFICGNGGSAGNAIHLANDFIYGARDQLGKGLRVEALSANSAVITCLANDLNYQDIYSEQLRVKANEGDVLIALSGSGNSPNICKAIEVGNNIGMITFAITGFTGGRCKNIASYPIHFPVSDMQISEDMQLIVGHMCMQWLRDQANKVELDG